jgi:hypothetical protein
LDIFSSWNLTDFQRIRIPAGISKQPRIVGTFSGYLRPNGRARPTKIKQSGLRSGKLNPILTGTCTPACLAGSCIGTEPTELPGKEVNQFARAGLQSPSTDFWRVQRYFDFAIAESEGPKN